MRKRLQSAKGQIQKPAQPDTGRIMFQQAVQIAFLKTMLVTDSHDDNSQRYKVFRGMLAGELGKLVIN